MTADTLTQAIRALREDRENLVAALTAAPPANGTDAVLRMIHEIQK